MAVLTRAEARAIVDAVLGASRADATVVDVGSREGGNVRFANNGVTTAGEVTDATVSVTATFGTRSGSASTNALDPDALREVVARAERAARLAPEDPEYVPPVEPGTYPAVDAWREATAAFGPGPRAEAAAAAIAEAASRETTIAGFLESWRESSATANSAGVFEWFPSTWLEYTNTVRTPDGTGSGWAGARLHDAARLDAAARARIAAEKAVAARDSRPLEPGDWPVILEPAAVAVMAGALVGQMDARRAMEGRSYLSAPGGRTKLGERLLAPIVSLRTDPAHPVAPGRPWSSDQLPARPTTWFEDGTVTSLRWDRWWAREHGESPVPASTNLVMAGEDRSLEALIRETERAVLVTRLWYIRALNPSDLTLTGLTRDGTYLVEDGRIAHGVNNFRWNESPVRFFAAAEALSRPERVADADWATSPSYVPAVRSGSFHFSSVSRAV